MSFPKSSATATLRSFCNCHQLCCQGQHSGLLVVMQTHMCSHVQGQLARAEACRSALAAAAQRRSRLQRRRLATLQRRLRAGQRRAGLLQRQLAACRAAAAMAAVAAAQALTAASAELTAARANAADVQLRANEICAAAAAEVAASTAARAAVQQRADKTCAAAAADIAAADAARAAAQHCADEVEERLRRRQGVDAAAQAAPELRLHSVQTQPPAAMVDAALQQVGSSVFPFESKREQGHRPASLEQASAVGCMSGSPQRQLCMTECYSRPGGSCSWLAKPPSAGAESLAGRLSGRASQAAPSNCKTSGITQQPADL